MKTKAICSFFVLFAIAAVMISSTPAAFADHSEVTIGIVEESGFSQECAEVGCYTPSTATVEVGAHVTMTNTDTTGVHTFTSGTVDGFTPSPSEIFDSGILTSGESIEWIPETAGEVPYYCMLHTWMIGTIIVEEGVDEDAEAAAAAEAEKAMMDDVELMVTITDSVVNDATQVDLEFSTLHVNYEIIAMQNGETVLQETAHAMEMTSSHMVDAIGSDDSPIDIEIVSLGIGPPDAEADWTGPTGTVATLQVVPEFGTIAMMILAVAIISIVAVTAKSRVIPRF